jgi:hypothetical protein
VLAVDTIDSRGGGVYVTQAARKAMALICYVVAMAGAGMFGAFVLAHGIGWLDDRPHLPDAWPWLIDGA